MKLRVKSQVSVPQYKIEDVKQDWLVWSGGWEFPVTGSVGAARFCAYLYSGEFGEIGCKTEGMISPSQSWARGHWRREGICY